LAWDTVGLGGGGGGGGRSWGYGTAAVKKAAKKGRPKAKGFSVTNHCTLIQRKRGNPERLWGSLSSDTVTELGACRDGINGVAGLRPTSGGGGATQKTTLKLRSANQANCFRSIISERREFRGPAKMGGLNQRSTMGSSDSLGPGKPDLSLAPPGESGTRNRFSAGRGKALLICSGREGYPKLSGKAEGGTKRIGERTGTGIIEGKMRPGGLHGPSGVSGRATAGAANTVTKRGKRPGAPSPAPWASKEMGTGGHGWRPGHSA